VDLTSKTVLIFFYGFIFFVQFFTKIKITKSTVSDTIRRFKCTGTYKDRKRTGRPCKTSKAEDKSIILSCKRNRRLTAKEIKSNFNAAHNKTISEKTVRRRLKTVGLNG
jgi:transposase